MRLKWIKIVTIKQQEFINRTMFIKLQSQYIVIKMMGLEIILILISATNAFQFSPPSVTAVPLTINTPALYEITIDRAYTSDLIQTRWMEEPVPDNSNITVVFPTQYSFTPTNEPILQALSIDGLEVQSPVLVRTDSRTVVITNSILQALPINLIILTLSNVLNPSPALTTSPFTVTVGNDYSSLAGVSNSIITLVPDKFTSCELSFNPSTTNTTGDMILKITPKTPIPIGGSVVVNFPVTLQWSEDVSLNNPLEIDKVNDCSILSTQISEVTCMGVRQRQEIKIQFESQIFALITKDFMVTVKGLFSPPTVNAPDILKISSETNDNFLLDTCEVRVTDLQPQELNLFSEASLSPLFIDSWTTLSLNFSNTDTIGRDDYFQIVFPSPTTISFLRSLSNLALNAGFYNSSSLTLRFNSLISATNINQNTNNYIRFLNYRTPLTTRETDFIYLTIYSSGGRKKMEGKTTLKAVQRIYNISQQRGDDLGINQLTTYFLTINVLNTVSSSAMVEISLPSELKITNTSVCPKSLNQSASSSTTCTVLESENLTRIMVRSLWSAIPSGQQIIQLPLLLNPGYSTNLSQFKVSLFFNQSEDHLVADYFSFLSDNLTILPDKINPSNAKVELNDYSVGANNITYHISFLIENDIPQNGIVDLQMTLDPDFLFTPGTGFSCLITYNEFTDSSRNCSFNTTQNSIQVSNAEKIPASTTIKISLVDCCSNPYNTRPRQFPGIQTLTSAFNLIQYLDTPLIVSGFISIPVKSQSVIRESDVNSQSNTWNINFEQVQPIDQLLSRIELVFPLWNALSGLTSVRVSNTAIAQQVNFTISNGNKSLDMIIPETMVNSKTFNLTLTKITNPPTLEPLTYRIVTRTSDSYVYTSSNFTLLPTLTPSLFRSFNYIFETRIVGTLSALVMTIGGREDSDGQIGQFMLSNLSQYMEDNNTVICDDSTIYVCSTSPDNQTLTISITNTSTPLLEPLVINVSNLYIRTSTDFIPMTFSSFSITGFKISQYTNIQFGPLCTLPCKQCVDETQLSKCTSCYESPEISLQKYLLNFSCYQDCPNGTFNYFDTSLTTYQYICQNCSTQCLTCDILGSNCTSCNVSSSNKYFYTFQCLQICPNLTFPTTGSADEPICRPCVSPCLLCTSETDCNSCVEGYFFYLDQCLLSCPQNITVQNVKARACDNCSSQCKSCQDQTTKCLECATIGNITYLYVQDQYQCVESCPNDRVIDKTLKKCVFCESPCSTCFGVQNNCTSCMNGTFLSFSNANKCVMSCEPLSFQNATSNKCQSCTVAASLNCKNCSSGQTCYECDKLTVYVFFGLNSSCLQTVPPGYVNVSGVAVECETNCKECTLTPSTCSVCNQGQFLLNGECGSSCGDGFVGVGGRCLECEGGCQKCSVSQTNCTQCYHVYYFVNKSASSPSLDNQCVIRCPSGYYHSSFNISQTGKTCNICESPCRTCDNLSYCLSCETGYIYNGQCYDICPNNTLQTSSEMACFDCTFPCSQCTNATYQCTSCVSGYYLYQAYKRCYMPENCPANLSVAHFQTQTCQACQPFCFTCVNSTKKCLSCIQNTYLYKQGYECVTTCPSGYYASFGQCLKCKSQCKQCQTSSNCSQCTDRYYLHSYQCLAQCPVAYSIVTNGICTKCRDWCVNCSIDNYCYECDSTAILLKGDCLLSCPPSLTQLYNISTNKRACLTAEELASVYLQDALSGPSLQSILPLPFAIISSFIFAASFMSKIQYQGTYIFGWAYVVYGTAQVGSLVYFFYKFLSFKHTHLDNLSDDPQLQYDFLLNLLFGCLGLIAILNFLSTTCGSFFLTEDQVFAEWMRIKKRKLTKKHTNLLNQQSSNQVLNVSQGSISEQNQTADQRPVPQASQKICCEPMNSFLLATVVSLITTFKFRFILFCRLFDLIFFSAKLEDVQKFRFFNILTLMGFCYEGCGIYIMYKVLTIYERKFEGEFLLTAIDCISLLIVNIMVGVISMNKGSDFFKQDQDKIVTEKQQHDEKVIQNDKIASNNALSSKRKLHSNNPLPDFQTKIANTYDEFALNTPKKSTKKTKNALALPSKTLLPSKLYQKQPELIPNKNIDVLFQVVHGKLIPIQQIPQQDDNSNNIITNLQDKIIYKKVNQRKNMNDSQSPKRVQSELKIKQIVSEIIPNKEHKRNSEWVKTNKKLVSPPQDEQNDFQGNKKAEGLNEQGKKRRNKPSKLLQHSIRSPNNPANQQLLKSKFTETVRDWQPKIKQARLKRSSLSQMDLIDLYNPNLDVIEQFKKSSSDYSLPMESNRKINRNDLIVNNQRPQDFFSQQDEVPTDFEQKKITWLNKINEEPESLEVPAENFNLKSPSINTYFDNRTLEEAKIFSNPNINPSIQNLPIPPKIHSVIPNPDIHEESYERILPFIYVQQTHQFIQQSNHKSKKNKHSRSKFIQQSKNHEMKVKNIFEKSENSDEDQNSIEQQISDDRNENFPESSKKIHSFGH